VRRAPVSENEFGVPGEPTVVAVRSEGEPAELRFEGAALPVERRPNVAPEELGFAERIYRDHYEFVWRNARRLGAADEWVDDAVHEAFLVATRRLPEFEGRSSVRTWLFAITLRVVQRMRRDRARYDARLQALRAEPAQLGATPHEREDAARQLRQLLAGLDEPKRVVLILAELEGMTSAEIAGELGLKRGTVESRLRAARTELSAAIERQRAREKGPRG
jgi:RNA polymerase sigma-70 factor, ECF subfamily